MRKLILMVALLAMSAAAQNTTAPNLWSGPVYTNLSVGSPTYRTVIYFEPKDDKVLIESFDAKNKKAFTVFVDGTVKVESGADVDKASKEFWKTLADAFAEWKQSACAK